MTSSAKSNQRGERSTHKTPTQARANRKNESKPAKLPCQELGRGKFCQALSARVLATTKVSIPDFSSIINRHSPVLPILDQLASSRLKSPILTLISFSFSRWLPKSDLRRDYKFKNSIIADNFRRVSSKRQNRANIQK